MTRLGFVFILAAVLCGETLAEWIAPPAPGSPAALEGGE